MTVLITGVAGFIGAHVAQALLAQGRSVIGFDNLNHYYSSRLKQDRLATLCASGDFSFHEVDVASPVALHLALDGRRPTKILHLAAQAGCGTHYRIQPLTPKPICKGISRCSNWRANLRRKTLSMRPHHRSMAVILKSRLRRATRPMIRSPSMARPKSRTR